MNKKLTLRQLRHKITLADDAIIRNQTKLDLVISIRDRTIEQIRLITSTQQPYHTVQDTQLRHKITLADDAIVRNQAKLDLVNSIRERTIEQIRLIISIQQPYHTVHDTFENLAINFETRYWWNRCEFMERDSLLDTEPLNVQLYSEAKYNLEAEILHFLDTENYIPPDPQDFRLPHPPSP